MEQSQLRWPLALSLDIANDATNNLKPLHDRDLCRWVLSPALLHCIPAEPPSPASRDPTAVSTRSMCLKAYSGMVWLSQAAGVLTVDRRPARVSTQTTVAGHAALASYAFLHAECDKGGQDLSNAGEL